MTPFGGLWSSTGGSKRNVREGHVPPSQKQFLDLPLAQKFVGIFAVLTLLSGALMIGALHLGLSVFEEKFYEKSLQELDFFVQKVDDDIQGIDTLTRSIAVDSTIQQQMNALSNADPETANYYYLLTGIRPLLLEKSIRTGKSAACNIPICMDIH